MRIISPDPSRGYSLIELLLVIALATLLAGVAVPMTRGAVEEVRAGAAHVLRCVVWSLDASGVRYHGALRFDQEVAWRWAEGTRRVPVLPEHERPVVP